MKRRSGSNDSNAHKEGGENKAKKAKPAGEAGGFWVETKGDPKVRAQLAREKEIAKRRQEELEQRQRQEEEVRRAEDALVRQVASFIPVVPGTELSTITVSAYRIIPLLPFAPPSPKVHTVLVRMRPNEVFGHRFHASAEYHTLLSPFTSGALFIDAVAPTEAMINMKEERDKLRSSHAQSPSSSSSSSSSPVADHVASAQLDPAYSVLDEDIRNVLAKKRAQEDPKGMQKLETKAETVLVLRSFYEEASKQKNQAQLSVMAPAGLPISPSATTLRESAARRYFVLDLKEAEERQPLKLRVAPPVAEEDSGDSESESDSDSDSDDEAEGAAGESKEDGDNERERGDTKSEAVVEGGADGASGDKAMEVVLDGQPTTANTMANTTATTTTTTMPTAAAPSDTMPAAATSDGLPTAVPAENRGEDEAESEAAEGEQRAAGAQQAATSSTDPGLLPEETVDELVSHYLRIPGFYADSAMQIPRAWVPLANSLMPIEAADGHAQRPMDVEAESAHPPAEASSTPPPRVVITGRKGMGKSTISQFLLNSLLNRYPHVVFLDTDLGQPEFTPAGLVSLHVISAPVFGPSFMHLASPLKAYFMGDVSVDEVFETYSQAMRMLADYYYTATLPGTDIPLSRLPLIVNTHGWLKGLGFEVLRNLIRYLGPDVAVHLYPSTLEYADKGPDFPFVEEEVGYRFRAVHLLPAVVPKRVRMLLGPDDLRRLRLDAYFDCWNEGSLVTQIPYRVPWNAIRLALADADVPPSECLLAFNASLVGLCVDTADYLSCAPPGQADLSRGQSIYPSFLLSAPRCECVGLGIVRTIDPVTHQFLVLTPVPPERLQRVNTFVKGAIHLPAPTLLRGGWLSNPYLMTEAISRPGGAKMTGRPNIQRKHTASSGTGRK